MLTGCLRNLNETEFFRKLEIKGAEYYDLVLENQAEIEAEIKKRIEDEMDKTVEWITFWGEGRYACGSVIVEQDGKKFVQVLGKYQLEGEDYKNTYAIWFIPDSDGIMEEVILYN